MRKYLLLISIIILIIYYITSFLISFTLLAKSVVNNDSVSLERYINVKELRSNFYGDIYEYSSNLIKSLVCYETIQITFFYTRNIQF